MTVGIDLGDRRSHFVVMDAVGEVIEEGQLLSRPGAFRQRFGAMPPARVVIEMGSLAGWVGRLRSELGHEVVVANPRRVALVSGNDDKSHGGGCGLAGAAGPRGREAPLPRRAAQRTDASRSRGAAGARGARALPHAAHQPRARRREEHRRAPAALIDRGLPQARPWRLAGDARREPHAPARPDRLAHGLIRGFDRRLEAVAEERYPPTALLRQVPGVGVQTALAFVLALEDPTRFPTSRAVGLVPRASPQRAAS
jgi:transposase